MPGFDGTGPRGQGPMTGGGFGPCNQRAGRGQYGGGRGMQRGMGRGRGGGYGMSARRFSGWYAGPPNPAGRWGFQAPSSGEEMEVLKEQAGALEEELKAIKSRIDELGAGTAGEE